MVQTPVAANSFHQIAYVKLLTHFYTNACVSAIISIVYMHNHEPSSIWLYVTRCQSFFSIL